MKQNEIQNIEETVRIKDGLTVPDGYFEDFATRMAASLPFRQELDVPVESRKPAANTRWLRVRPYVYMAAMFAGAWCLIKMFTLMSPTGKDVSISNYPALSVALEDERFIDEYVIDGVSSYDIMEESYMTSLEADGTDPEEFSQEEIMAVDTEEEPSYILPTGGDQNRM